MSQETPRTKEATFVLNTDYGEAVDVVWPEKMEKLERELNEAKRQAELYHKDTQIVMGQRNQLRQGLAESKKAVEYEREHYNELYHRFPTTAQVMIQMSKEIQLEKDLAEANRKLVLYEAQVQAMLGCYNKVKADNENLRLVLANLLQDDSTYPLDKTANALIDAVQILLNEKNYDGDQHSRFAIARNHATIIPSAVEFARKALKPLSETKG